MPILKIVTSCLWCEKVMPWEAAHKSKMICSMKCLGDLNKAIEKQNGKGSSGYDKSDVYFPKINSGKRGVAK